MVNENSTESKSESAHQRRLRQQISGVFNPDLEDDRLYAMEVSDRHFAEKQALKQQLLTTEQQLTETQQKLTEAEKAAFIDSLTGCYNRNYWEDYVSNNPDPTRDNGQLIIFSADVNELKFANDALGYDAGDLLLQYTAGLLRRLFPRSEDKIIRLGGDEFIVLCSSHSGNNNYQETLNTISERLRLDRENSNMPNVNVGIGSALYDKSTDNSIEDTKAKADCAMKVNKYLVANATDGESPDISAPADYYKALSENPDFAAYLERSRLPKEAEQLQA